MIPDCHRDLLIVRKKQEKFGVRSNMSRDFDDKSQRPAISYCCCGIPQTSIQGEGGLADRNLITYKLQLHQPEGMASRKPGGPHPLSMAEYYG